MRVTMTSEGEEIAIYEANGYIPNVGDTVLFWKAGYEATVQARLFVFQENLGIMDCTLELGEIMDKEALSIIKTK